MSEARPRLLFVQHTDAADLAEDRALLEARFEVSVYRFQTPPAGGGSLRKLLLLLREGCRQLGWLQRELARASVVYCCFADYHVVLPLALGRRRRLPVVLRLGGYDANTLPELGYGVFASRWRAPLARWALQRATHLVPVTASLMGHHNEYARWPLLHRDGVRAHCPGLRTPWTAIATGYEPRDWPPGPDTRPAVVATVAYLDRERTLRLKGIDVLVEAARRLPEVEFRLVGVAPAFAPTLRNLLQPPGNVRLLPPVPRSGLLEVYQQASVYAQLSRSEGGLPNVLGEAMLCGCVPLVSAVGGMPETTGGLGVVVARPLPEEVAAGVRQALGLGTLPDRRAALRASVAERYSLDRRRDQLLGLLETLLRQARPAGTAVPAASPAAR